jgi:hypothetical protein
MLNVGPSGRPCVPSKGRCCGDGQDIKLKAFVALRQGPPQLSLSQICFNFALSQVCFTCTCTTGALAETVKRAKSRATLLVVS